MNKKIPETSLVAYRMMSCDLKQNHWNKIMLAMKILSKPSSMQKIAEKAELDYHAVGRRMGELQAEGLVYVADRGLTDTNRPCSLYALTQSSSLSEVKEPEPEEEPTNYFQPSLF